VKGGNPEGRKGREEGVVKVCPPPSSRLFLFEKEEGR